MRKLSVSLAITGMYFISRFVPCHCYSVLNLLVNSLNRFLKHTGGNRLYLFSVSVVAYIIKQGKLLITKDIVAIEVNSLLWMSIVTYTKHEFNLFYGFKVHSQSA